MLITLGCLWPLAVLCLCQFYLHLVLLLLVTNRLQPPVSCEWNDFFDVDSAMLDSCDCLVCSIRNLATLIIVPSHNHRQETRHMDVRLEL
jgi:hypothetical protein